MDYSPPSSSIHGIFWARILEWVAISSFRGSSQPTDRNHISYLSCVGRQVLYHYRHLGSLKIMISTSKICCEDQMCWKIQSTFVNVGHYLHMFTLDHRKSKSSRKTSISALLTVPKPLTVWITVNCRKFFKRWEYQTTWPASWETCMQVRKQQLELDMEQQTGSK